MSTCSACGASYDDTFKFCPHCGRAKPEPEWINLNVQVAPVRYEEAVLKIEVVGTTELTEPPFDWRPSGLTKLLGEGGQKLDADHHFRLLLDCFHPQRGSVRCLPINGVSEVLLFNLVNSLKFPERFRNNELVSVLG